MSARAQLFVFKLQLAMGNVMHEIFMNLQVNYCSKHCSSCLNGVVARPRVSLRPLCLHVQFSFSASFEWCLEASGRSQGTGRMNVSASFKIFLDKLQVDTIVDVQTR